MERESSGGNVSLAGLSSPTFENLSSKYRPFYSGKRMDFVVVNPRDGLIGCWTQPAFEVVVFPLTGVCSVNLVRMRRCHWLRSASTSSICVRAALSVSPPSWRILR
jgi:hypothetical protein